MKINKLNKKKIFAIIALVLAVILIILNVTGVFRNMILNNARNSTQTDLNNRIKDGRDVLFSKNANEINNISYLDDNNKDHYLDVLMPKNVTGSLPTIVNVHGGGLLSGEKEINTLQSRYFASQGYCVVNVNYTRMPEGNHKTMIQNIYFVLHWMDKNEQQYNFNLEKVYMTGDSAGGQIVSIMAAVLNGESLRTYYDVEQPSFQVQRFALSCPMVGTETLVKPETLVNWIFHYGIGPKIYKNSEAMSKASVYQIMDECDYPNIFISTTKDDSAFYPQAEEFHQFLMDKDIQHEYKVYEGKEHKLQHVFNVAYPEWEESIEANQDIVDFFK